MNSTHFKDFIPILKKVSIFSDLTENHEAFEILLSMLEKRQYDKDQFLIKEGESGDEFYILISGKVAIAKNTPEGDNYRVLILDSTTNPSFGEGGLIDGEKRSASVVAETSVEVLILNLNSFTNFAKNHPEFAYPILKKIAKNLMTRLNQTSRDLMLLHKALMDEIRSN